MISESVANIIIAGDFFLKSKGTQLNSTPKALFNDFLPLIEKADLAVVNFEGPIDLGRNPSLKSGPVLKAHSQSIEILKKAGFNLLSLATNHIMDLGYEGLRDTIRSCENEQLSYVGVGNSLTAARLPKCFTIKHYRIAIINIAENEFSTTHGDKPGANPLNVLDNFYDINQIKKKADFVLVIVHGGHEHYALPSPRMKGTYRFFVDAGADAVVCHHSHCHSGYEIYNGAPIIYGLGNLIFEWHGDKAQTWYTGCAVQFLINNEKLEFSLQPYSLFDDKLGLRLLNEEEKIKFQKRISELNSIILDDSKLSNSFDEFCERNRKIYYKFIEPHSLRLLHALRNRGLFPSFLSKQKKRYLLNLIRCESHRDVLIKLLDSSG